MKNNKKQHVPVYLIRTYEMLECAFPTHISEEDYLPLLVVLAEKLSHRNLAEVVGLFMNEDYVIVLNDVYRALSLIDHAAPSVIRIKQQLIPCRYEIWLTED
jgi:hypothetical protein